MGRSLLGATLGLTLCVGCSSWAAVPPVLAVRAAPARRCAAQRMLVCVDLDSAQPPGPDPYKLVYDEIDYIKGSIKGALKANRKGTSGSAITSNEVLTMAAREFMQRKGKSFRPMLVLLIGRATDPDFVTGTPHSKLAVISEMIHTASIIHADVLEEDETDMSQGTLVHQEVAHDVGNKVCILAGDFLLAKAAVELSLLESSAVTEIVAEGLESICEGNMMRPRDGATAHSLQAHHQERRASVAQLIANCCKCSAILSGHEVDSIVARACAQYGESLAMARTLVTEADEVETAMRKCRRDPRRLFGLLPSTCTTPLFIAAEHDPKAAAGWTWSHGEMANHAAHSATAAELLEKTNAVRKTREMAAEHAQEAADSLGALPASATRDALLVLCHKILMGAPLK